MNWSEIGNTLDDAWMSVHEASLKLKGDASSAKEQNISELLEVLKRMLVTIIDITNDWREK